MTRIKNVLVTLLLMAAVIVMPTVASTSSAMSPYDVSDVCGEAYTGVLEYGGEYRYVEDGWLTDHTGFVMSDGTCYYFENGVVDRDMVALVDGTIDGTEGKWCVYGGIVDLARNEAVLISDNWYYIRNGMLQEETGIVEISVDGDTGPWYVQNGIVQVDYTGFVKDGDDWRYVVEGKLDTESSGLLPGTISGVEGEWYAKDGMFNGNYTGIVRSGQDYTYVKDGMADYTYQGVVKATIDDVDTLWYIKDGLVQMNFTGEATVDDKTYSVTNGQAEEIESEAPDAGAVAAEEAKRKGMVGRLYISSADIDVALFNTSISDSAGNQAVVDADDSAAYMPYKGGVLIADHYVQAFSTLYKVKKGDVLTIDDGSSKQQFVCVKTTDGINTGRKLLENDGTDVYDEIGGRLCLYTCKDDAGEEIVLTFWEPK